jgi:hypothetical protein
MQPLLTNKKTLLAAALMMSMSNASIAKTEPFTVTAQAIPDVDINLVQNVTFGTAIYTTTGGNCSLDGLVPSEAAIQSDTDGDNATTTAAGGNFGGVSGTGCVTSTTNGSRAGIYEITGDAGALVSLTLSPLVETAFTYTPGLGCYVLYDDADFTNDADSDPCIFLSTGVTSNIVLGDTNGGSNPDPGEVDGAVRFSIGGVLNITNGGVDLVAGQAYPGSFDIVVVYE